MAATPLPRGMNRVEFSVKLCRGRGRTGEHIIARFPPETTTAANARFARLSEHVLAAFKDTATYSNKRPK